MLETPRAAALVSPSDRALGALIDAARHAGAIAARHFRLGAQTSAAIDYKAGGSPVTAADLAADAYLRDALGAAFPGAGWLSEETVDSPQRLARREILIVDPIDGTRAFLSGDPRWAVSIALVVDGRPVAGVVHAPSLSETYAAARGQGATRNGAPIRASARTTLDGARAGGPKRMIESIARGAGARIEVAPRTPSLAYRLALVASGALDFAVASTNSNEWDVAAADIVLGESGAALLDPSGAPLAYNRLDTRYGPLLAAPAALLAPIRAASPDLAG